MKIWLVYDYLSEVGGVERVMATHARWFQGQGHEVSLIFSYVDEKTREYSFLNGLDIKEMSSFKIKSEPIKLFSSLLGFNNFKKHKVDFVICYSFPSLFSTRGMDCKKGFYYLPMEFVYFPLKKKIEWANDIKRKLAVIGSFFLSPVLKRWDKKLIENKLVIANSEFTKNEISQRYGVESFVSYPPLNDVFKPEKDYGSILEKYGIKKDFILTAGRIIPDKKTDWLIEVFSKIKGEMDFVIAGEISGEHKEELLRLGEKLNLKGRIRILGLVNQEELVKLYTAAKVFVFASPKEAFGLVPIEAMACGTPVVAWDDKAGPNEYVLNKINGYLAKPYSTIDFKEKVENVLRSDFKKKNKVKIINSIKKFLEKSQADLFLRKVENYIQ
ncbi:MAG: glycosyltransferase family 4 protein [archaeon]